MTPEHRILLEQLRAAGRGPGVGFDPKAYLRTDSTFLNVPVPERRRIARAWLKAHKAWPTHEVLALIDDLVRGATHEEKTLGLLIAEGLGGGRRPFGPSEVERWLDHLDGWAEVDSLCQSLFGPEDLLGDWPAWSALIRRLAKDANINRRRAALVLLTRSARTTADRQVRDLAFETIDALKLERQIIITKAVSWLLRSLAERHPDDVRRYLETEGPALPAIALREARAKLATGRKTPRRGS